MALLPEDPKQQKLLVAGLAVAAILYAFWSYWYSPKREEIAGLEERLETLETQNRRAQILATRGRKELEERLQVYERHIARLEELIPRGEEVPELLDAMALEARRTGVDLALMRPEPPDEGEFYTRRSYSMGVIGPYHEVGRFLTSIASLPRIVTPVDLSLEPTTGTTSAGEEVPMVEARFRILTYVLRSGTEERPASEAETPTDGDG